MSGSYTGRAKGSRVTKLPTPTNLGDIDDLSYFSNRTIGGYTMATMASGRGLIAKNSDLTGIYQLKKQAEQMGLTPEIKELSDGVKELSELIQRKNYELSILEAFAMESPDENITELRNQLFLTVKLIHSEEIEKLLNDANAERRFSNHDSDDYYDSDDSDVKKSGTTAREFKNNLFSRLREAYNKRKALKKELKQVKENFKRRQNHISTVSEETQCESSG